MSQYLAGTANVTNGSATVTGTNTLWLANVTAGDSFTVAGDGVMYYVASVDTDTQVTLSAPYAGDRKSTRLNSSHLPRSRMPSSA